MALVAGFSHASVRIERAFTGEPSYAVACAVADDSLPAAHGCGGRATAQQQVQQEGQHAK